MKKGYKIGHYIIAFEKGILIVTNYNGLNKISHYNFRSKEDACIDTNDIGMWKIKKLKHE